MKNIRYYLEYKALAAIGKLLQVMPRRLALAFGRRAGDLIYYCIPIRKKITLEHLRLAFPEKKEGERRDIARKAYQSLAMNSFEHLCLDGLSTDQLLDIVTFENETLLREAFDRGKGVIFVGGHFGNWEYMGGAISAKGYPMAYVVSSIANPHIDTIVNRNRQEMGIEILPKGMTVRSILKTLKNNGGMALLMDQDSGRNGVFIEYFGRKCSTPKGPALFALKTGASMLFVSAVRQPDSSIKAVVEEVAIDYSKGTTEDNIFAVMQECTRMLEKYVRSHPGQWFWMHRRWKTRPE